MKTINLTNLDKSEIKYKISRFPDGQQNITLEKDIRFIRYNDRTKEDELIMLYTIGDNIKEVKIISHLNNWLDLEIIVCTVACLRELDVETIHLVTPYFVGARSDRKFEEGGNWYLKQVICPVINSLNFKSVLILDPHSWVLGNLITKFKYVDNEEVVRFAIQDLKYVHNENDFILVSPDAGASHKIVKISEKIGYKGDIIICSKERDTNGELTQTKVNKEDVYEAIINNKDFIIIDDICDGGRTFINIVKAIKDLADYKDYNKSSKFYLIVTHGIFSSGFEKLSDYIDGIYCTNSVNDINKSTVKVQTPNNNENFVKQLNVY